MSLRDRFRPVEEAFCAPARAPTEAQAAQTLSAKRGRASVSPPPSAGKTMTALLRPLLKDTGLGLAELKRRWTEIAGESFSKCTPSKLAGGVLTLQVPSAIAPFIQQQELLIVDRLRLAGAKVKSVRIEQRAARAGAPEPNIRPLQKAPLNASEEAALAHVLDPVADPGLKSALMRLGRAVKQG
jgi:hypothetical protein